MGQISTVEYLGKLRTKAVHLVSGREIYTDAPKDNEGKGELFAPTDQSVMGSISNQHELK